MGQVAAGLLVVDFREKTLYFNHGFNDRGFSIGNSTFGSESSVSKGKSAIITVSGLSGPSGRRSPCCGFSRKTIYFNHGFNDRGFSIGNSTFSSESSVSKGKSAIITVSGLSGPSGRRSPCCGFSRKKHFILITALMTADFQ